MADEPQGLAIPERPKGDKKKPRLRKRRLSIDADEAVEDVLQMVKDAQDERSDWMEQRLIRYGKLRGWKDDMGDSPWSNVHVPVIAANSLRVKAGLFNAVLGIRPVMTPKVTQFALKDAAEQANQVIDHQVFVEADGEKQIDKIINSFVDEGTFVSHQRWVKDTQTLHDVRVLPRPERPLIEAMVSEILPLVMPGAEEIIAKDADGYEWTAVIVEPDESGGTKRDVKVSVYDHPDESKIEVCLAWDATVFDGPSITVHDLEDVVVPMRSENPQAITAQNPFGAPWIARMIRVPIDEIRKRKDDGTYDLLSGDDVDDLDAVAIARTDADANTNEQAIKDEKDAKAGLTPGLADDADHVTVIEWYGPRQVNGDSTDEVILTAIKETRQLARARYLTEMYPGVPVQRPFAHERFIPVSGEFYGIGLVELMEGLHDILHQLFNMNLDAGKLANMPFGFYRPSSGLKADKMEIEPGVMFPTDVPQQDVYFPTLPHADQSWSFNMIGLVTQLQERLVQMGAMQFGQVPQGKASALRTASTTFAILQQGSALPEQILRRLFSGLAQIWHQIHQMNAKYLPKGKQYLIVGRSMDQQDAYGVVDDPQKMAVPLMFDFTATLLNTNKGLVAQALTGLGGAIFNPMSFQFGTVTAENYYNWKKDLIQAQQLDPSRYITKPKGAPSGGQRFMFEEALLLIMQGRLPEVAPQEPIEEHFQKAQAFMESDQFGVLTPGPLALFMEYTSRLKDALNQQMQEQQMQQTAAQFAASLQNQGQGTGAPMTMGQPPEMQAEQGTAEELAGAEGRA